MAKSSENQTAVRRSKRFQPLIGPPGSGIVVDGTLSWLGTPRHVRDTEPHDLWEEEREEWDRDSDGDDQTKTSFYDAFTRPRRTGSALASRAMNVVTKNKEKGRTKGKGKMKEIDIETFKVGDTVLVATAALLPSVAIIVSMWETSPAVSVDGKENPNGAMHVEVHWFLRPKELAGIRAKRNHIENEIYFSLASCAVLSTSQIICHCTVSGELPPGADSKSTAAWSLSPSKRSKTASRIDGSDSGNETFVCHLAVDSKRGLFYELDWESHYTQAMKEPSEENTRAWDVVVDNNPPKTPKKKRKPEEEVDEGHISNSEGEDSYHDTEDVSDDSNDELPSVPLSSRPSSLFSEPEEPTTPKKRQRKAVPSTPRKKSDKTTKTTPSASTTPRRSRRTLAAPTPHSKAALRARAQKKSIKKIKSLPVISPRDAYKRNIQQLDLPDDPWLRAMHVLHVSARPDALPCREEEYVRVLRAVEELLEEGSGGCVYISGVPGAGKTATVHAVVRELKRMAEQNEANPFTYVEINGLRIPEPSAAYGLLWEAISGRDVASEGHLKISAKESLKRLTQHFSSSVRAGPGGHACVVLMDELDQLMTATQDVVYNFFNWPTLAGSKLIVLAVANTMDLPERVMTGRVRSRLGMIRINFQPYTTQQLQEIVHARLQCAKEGLNKPFPEVIDKDGIRFAAMKVSSISGDARRILDICRRTVELVQPNQRMARTEDVKNVIKVMQNSPTAAYISQCSLHERIMMASLLKCIKREGIEEIKWGEVKHQHLIYMDVLPSHEEPTRKPTDGELSFVLDSLASSRAILVEEGVSVSRKPEGERRVLLNLDQSEVERVLSETGGQRWKNVLGT